MAEAKWASGTMRPGMRVQGLQRGGAAEMAAWRRMWAGPPLGVTMAGTPLARASRTTLPKVSVWEGKMRRSRLA